MTRTEARLLNELPDGAVKDEIFGLVKAITKVIKPPSITFDSDPATDKFPELPVKPDAHIDGGRDRLKPNTSGNKRRSSDKPGEDDESNYRNADRTIQKVQGYC